MQREGIDYICLHALEDQNHASTAEHVSQAQYEMWLYNDEPNECNSLGGNPSGRA